MSEAQTAVNGASFEGLIELREAAPTGMITLRGRVEEIAAPVSATLGVRAPDVRRVETQGTVALAWMSPDEMMVFCDPANVADYVAGLERALADQHALIVDVSDARAVLDMKGAALRDVLAKLCPADLSPESLPVGEMRRTRLAQIPVAFWFLGPHNARLICFRSVAQYAFDVLSRAADSRGEVGFFADQVSATS